MSRSLLCVAAGMVLIPAPIVAVTDVLTEREIAYALSIANGSDATRALFHASYTITVDDPVIDHLEVITEFRRFVLAAEDHLKVGKLDDGARRVRFEGEDVEGLVAAARRTVIHSRDGCGFIRRTATGHSPRSTSCWAIRRFSQST